MWDDIKKFLGFLYCTTGALIGLLALIESGQELVWLAKLAEKNLRRRTNNGRAEHGPSVAGR